MLICVCSYSLQLSDVSFQSEQKLVSIPTFGCDRVSSAYSSIQRILDRVHNYSGEALN